MKSKIKIPMLPNFISVDGVMRSLSDFAEEDLREIGGVWTDNLVRKARKYKPIKEIQL